MMTMDQVDHMSLVLLVRQGAIVGPIPTMREKEIGNRANQTVLVRRGHSTLPATIPILKPVAQHAQNLRVIPIATHK